MRKIIGPGFVLYLLVVILLLASPLSGTGIRLNEYFLGIRTDHYIHTALFLPFMIFCRLLYPKTTFFIPFFIGIFFCSLCETLHYFLPYREFSMQDYFANLTGLILGATAYLFRK
ncbi:MAG: VanZ like family [Crocinitomicaceae bacterium]|jgi:VanZ family protein|nr:VanZ like family [Crocinitomicaceae bacterium]